MRTYQFMWALIKYRRWLYSVNIILWIGVHASPMLPGLITKLFFDTLTGAHPEVNGPGLPSIIALLLGATAARCTVLGLGFFTSITSRNYMSGLLRRNLLARILERPGAAALNETPGEALSRFNEDVRQVEDAADWLLDVMGMITFSVSALVMLLSINPTMTLLVFLPVAGVLVVTQMAGTRLQQNRRKSRESTARVAGLIGEMFGAVQAIQVAGAEDRVIGHFRRLSDRRRTTMLRDRLLTQILDGVSGNTVALGTGMVLLLSARAMEAGTFSVGDFALFVYYLTFVSDSTQFVGRWVAHYRQTGVSFERLVALMQGAPAQQLVEHHPIWLKGEISAPAAPARPEADRLDELTAAGLTYQYPETGRGIEGIDLRLKRGSFTVIAGRIGAGKTTLLRALTGLLPAQAGEIRWNGRRVEEPATWFTPPRCAATQQIPLLFSDTLQGNILMGLPEQQSDIAGAIRSAVMERDLESMDDGLQTIVGSRGVRLSGGQIQRTAAARMFVREPELLIFDDLSSALDVETERILWERVFSKPDATCLAVSHRRAALRRADQILVIKDGRLVDEGSLGELLERCEEMRQLWQADSTTESETAGRVLAGGGIMVNGDSHEEASKAC